jgi:hypothetical protein
MVTTTEFVASDKVRSQLYTLMKQPFYDRLYISPL